VSDLLPSTFDVAVAPVTMYALVSLTGIAMTETALCIHHMSDEHKRTFEAVAWSAGDLGSDLWEVSSDIATLRCQVCGVNAAGDYLEQVVSEPDDGGLW
tara:strand:- start:307 stop:603 length:297 start_codon:yes stop_codon:yes gene_type:complete